MRSISTKITEAKVHRIILKDNLMFFIAIGLWTLVILYFNPRLLALLIGPENIIAKLAVILFVVCLDIFWFYTIFHIVVVTFSYFYREKKLALKPIQRPHPKVALLYTTYNDFQSKAVLSCLGQDYDNFHVFILDDSTDKKYIVAIDAFAEKFKNKITIIRRENRKGYKAGNINYALKSIASQFEYFAIADADSVFPSDFISKLLPYFSVNSRIGFVQAVHLANPKQKSRFARAMGFNLELHYKRYLLPKEKYGFVMFYGHGALIRTDVCQKIGGFPEIVSEDLAFTSVMRRHGYEGVLAENCICYESFPQTYRHYRRRTEKWIKGTLEFLFKEYPLFLKAKNISWFEKMDVFVCGLSLILGLPFLLFLLVAGIALPVYFTNFRFHGPVFIPPIPEGKTVVSMLSGLRYNVYWTGDFYLIMLIMIFYPLIPVLIDLAKKPCRMLEYMSISTFCFLSTLVEVSFHTLSFLFTRKADFLVTAHENYLINSKQNTSVIKNYICSSNNKKILIAEIFLASVFLVVSIVSRNLWLASVTLSLFLTPFVLHWDLEKKSLRYLVMIPFLFSIFLLILIGKSIVK